MMCRESDLIEGRQVKHCRPSTVIPWLCPPYRLHRRLDLLAVQPLDSQREARTQEHLLIWRSTG